MDEIANSEIGNKIILESLVKTYSKLNNDKYQNILCSISGGADSDVMLDMCFKCDKDKKIDYVWFNTGLEYQATKDHLKYLEQTYGIEIKQYRPTKSVPLSCREYGQPFLSKQVSEYISRLQRHNFKFEDKSFDELYKEYPHCKSALQWWCNMRGTKSHFNISWNKWLKEFMIQFPPQFRISNKCCHYAKKNVSHKIISENNYDLSITGVRKSEGGARATRYKSCFDEQKESNDNYRPLFWYKNEDKQDYEYRFDICHSNCYTEYGLKRTGCVGCPFGRNLEDELRAAEKYEPKLYKAICNVFKDSYEYTRKYKEFCDEQRKLLRQC